MRTTKSIFGLIFAAIPVIYCGGLLLYFGNLQRWTGVPVGDALNPTMLGLGALGLFFLIPFVLRIVRLFRGPRAPGAGGGGPDKAAPEEERSDFDPDAAIARYLARRGQGPDGPASPPGPQEGGAARPAARFGRKQV